MTAIAQRLSIEAGLSAGLRWLYGTVQPDNALVEPRGACLTVTGRRLRFLPVSAAGTPLIVVDTNAVHWAAGPTSPALNTLPATELRCLASELAALGIPAGRHHYHSLTGTIVLDSPAHCSLRAAVERFARGCPRHHGTTCDAPNVEGGHSCTWRAEGRRAAIWPDVGANQGDSR
jgi:hypothetical protein